MERLTLTSFGRQPVTAGQLAAKLYDETEVPPISKWDVLRDATTARKALGLRDRDLAVLHALLSFHPCTELGQAGPIVVFPSNRSLSERAHGMAESTLRRHLAALVKAGLILRHDSPNGKRYARKGQGGVIALAFGFDLSPLVHRAGDLADLAQATREEQAELSRLRERCVLMVRDAVKLVSYTETQEIRLLDALSAAQRHLRRQPTQDGLKELHGLCEALLDDLRALVETEDLSANDTQNERHIESQTPDIFDSDRAEKAEIAKPTRCTPLPMVLQACPELVSLSTGAIHDWRGLIHQAALLRTMIGIGDDVWREACHALGACEAAIAVACLLERLAEIKSPGGYLRVLTRKAVEGEVDINAMVLSLLSRREKCAA